MRVRTWIIGILLVSISASFIEARIEGLVLYLPFDENSGNIARDMSGHSNDGEIIEARRVRGKYGNGLWFNGVDSYVEVSYHRRYNLTEAITLAAWVKPAQLMGWQCIINGRRSKFGPYLLQMCGNKGEIGVMINNGTLWTWAGTRTAFDTKSFWHLVGTYDVISGYFTLYVNGQVDWRFTGQKSAIDPNEREGLIIGHNYTMGGQWFEGIIDEVAIFNRALTGGEVMDLYEGGIREQVTDITSMLKLTTTWAHIKVQ